MLTAKEVRDVLSYNKRTGIFRWKNKTNSRAPKDSVAGHTKVVGYIVIGIRGTVYLAHRLAWLIVNGEWPALDIDHRNGKKGDNRWRNLRHCDRKTNCQNRRSVGRRSKTGLLGSMPHGKRFRAEIFVDGRHVVLGQFDTAKLAHRAYIKAKRLHHAGCTI